MIYIINIIEHKQSINHIRTIPLDDQAHQQVTLLILILFVCLTKRLTEEVIGETLP